MHLWDPRALRVLARSGLVSPIRPHRAAGVLAAVLRDGLTPAAALAVSAVRSPDRVALVDDTSSTTYAELHRRCDAAAVLLTDRGVQAGEVVGLVGDASRRYVEAMLGAGRLGADVVYLNAGFSPAQVEDTCVREGVTLLLRDVDSTGSTGVVLDHDWDLSIEARLGRRPPQPTRRGRQVILTSGTSGRPKGSPRETGGALAPLVGLLDAMPLRSERAVLLAAPLFHAWGWAHLCISLLLRSTVLLTRDRRPDALLALMDRFAADTVITVPVVLARLVDAATSRDAQPPSPRVLAVSGSALPGSLATAALDAFGDCVYNLYGATEVGWVCVAGPADLRADPATAGRPVSGTVVRLVDADGAEVPAGQVGRIAVESALEVLAYTDGSSRPRTRGLVLTGDLGRWDDEGRLRVLGREDDMVVSGGENVFPGAVEDVLATHPDIRDVVVVGVPDAAFGQRLRAVVVRAPGSTLDEEAVRDHVRAHRARHEIPRDVVFLDALPRNAAGKVLRRELSG